MHRVRNVAVGLLLGLVCCRFAVAEPTKPAGPFRLVSAQKHKQLQAALPQVADKDVQELLRDPRLIFYTKAEMPPAYQDWDSGLPGLHSPSYNISADRSEPHGNGNREFPWSGPAGTHRASSVSTFHFLLLPRGDDGKALPIVWFRKHLRGDRTTGYGWRYPVGTVFGEVLQLQSPGGPKVTFEMRLRTREWDDWAVNVFRPFPKASDLAARLKQLRPDHQVDSAVGKLVAHLEANRPLKSHTLAARHPFESFRQRMGVDPLPPVGDDKLVTELLTTTTFQSALGATWQRGSNDLWTCAPTTSARFHIIPAQYDAGFIEADRRSCMRCHDTVNRHVRDFEPNREWYGRIRGSDGIFSFHPFGLGSISHNGMGVNISMRQELVNAGILVRYDRSKHDKDTYTSLPKLN